MSSTAWQPFPTDEMTLRLLIAACEINPDTGQTHLHDFLLMGHEPTSTDLVGGSEDPDDGDTPVYMVEYEPGQEPHSEHTVIITLAREILDLRTQLGAADRPSSADGTGAA